MTETGTFVPLHPRGGKKALRFGVMCNGTVFQRWQADALRLLQEQGHQVVLLIVDDRPVQHTSLFRRIMNKRWSTLLYSSLENRMFKPGAKRNIELQHELGDAHMLNCRVVQKGFSEFFQDADIAAIRNYQLDFMLRFGFNILRGDILSAARFGVWSFHHDDEMVYRGGPAGFWEIYRGDPVSGAVMQRLTDKLDGGIILKKGYLKTIQHSYRDNIGQLLSMSSAWPALVAGQLVRSMSAGESDPALTSPAPSVTTAPVFRVPGNLQMLKFLCVLLRNRVKFYYRELLAAEIWNVGVIAKPIHEVALGGNTLTPADVTWLPRLARLGYLADPAGFTEGNNLHILAEDYRYATQKADISEILFSLPPEGFDARGGAVYPCRVPGENLHLSYPYVFESGGVVYCLPESFQSSKITLYRREKPGGAFVQERVLLSGVRAVDPTIIFHEEMWWLFFTERDQSNTHLFLYYSANLAGEFHPHPCNPVKTDIRSARPAGTPFLHENVLYRPAQDCSVTYGGRIAINRVVKLTPEEYDEQPVTFLEPVKGSRYHKGLHTLSAVGKYTLIDGKRYQPDIMFFISQLRNKMRRKEPGDV